MAHNDHTSQLLYVNIRGVVDVTAGDNFLGLRDKKASINMGPILNGYDAWVF